MVTKVNNIMQAVVDGISSGEHAGFNQNIDYTSIDFVKSNIDSVFSGIEWKLNDTNLLLKVLGSSYNIELVRLPDNHFRFDIKEINNAN